MEESHDELQFVSVDELLAELDSCNVEVVQAATDREQTEQKARLINQPMGSNFDGNCN